MYLLHRSSARHYRPKLGLCDGMETGGRKWTKQQRYYENWQINV